MNLELLFNEPNVKETRQSALTVLIDWCIEYS